MVKVFARKDPAPFWRFCPLLEFRPRPILEVLPTFGVHAPFWRSPVCSYTYLGSLAEKIGQQHNIQQYISLYTWDTFYPCVHQNHLWVFAAKSSFYSLIWPKSPFSSEILWSWICWSLFLDQSRISLKPSQATCGDVSVVWWWKRELVTLVCIKKWEYEREYT